MHLRPGLARKGRPRLEACIANAWSEQCRHASAYETGFATSLPLVKDGHMDVWMNGYGGQYRLNCSTVFCSGGGFGMSVVVAQRSGAHPVTPSAEMTIAHWRLIEPGSVTTSGAGAEVMANGRCSSATQIVRKGVEYPCFESPLLSTSQTSSAILKRMLGGVSISSP